jgi:hypothetical protein
VAVQVALCVVEVLVMSDHDQPHGPRHTFELRSLFRKRTEVLAQFVNEVPQPIRALYNFAGLSTWPRKKHRKDLAGLNAFSKPPDLDMTSPIVGHAPRSTNPFEHRERRARH